MRARTRCTCIASERQEDEVVAVPDLNKHVPEAVELDRAIRRSYFAVFDGRECESKQPANQHTTLLFDL